MSEDKGLESFEEVDIPSATGVRGFLRRHAPYLLVLALALAGVAYTNMSQRPLVGYWEFLALITGAVSVFAGWDKYDEQHARLRLVWTQALHWVAVLIAMNIMLLAGVQQLLLPAGTSLVLLMLLALGAFLAGIHLLSIQLCFLGVVMALAVPALSWLQQSMLFFIVAAVFLIGLGLTFLPSRRKT